MDAPDSDEDEAMPSAPSTSNGLPADFFADPSQAPAPRSPSPEPAVASAAPVVEEEEEDEDLRLFEQEMAEDSTSSLPFLKTAASAQTSFAVAPKLFDVDEDGQVVQEEQATDSMRGEALPDETEEERKDREDREELMQRIDECVLLFIDSCQMLTLHALVRNANSRKQMLA